MVTRNVNSLLSKLPDMLEAIPESKSDIVVVTEAWINSEVNDTEVNMPDNIFFRCYCSENQIVGEVTLIIHKILKA